MRSLGSTIPPRCTAWSVLSPSALSAQHRICALLSPSHAGTYMPLWGLSKRPQVEEGHNDCLEVLVAAGADLNARWRSAGTVLCGSCALLSDALACPCIPHVADDWRTRF
jgi:hypothetical protein